MRSLKATLGLGIGVSLAAIVVLQWWLVSFTFREITENYVISRLQQEADMLLGALTFTPQAQPELLLHRQTHFDNPPFSGHYYYIRINDSILRSPTLWDQDLAIEPVAVGKQRQLQMPGPLDQSLLVLAQGFRKQGRHVTVAVAEDISKINREITAFQHQYLLLSAGLLLLLIDNAFKWAHSRVAITASRTSGDLQVIVEDDGQGCSAEMRIQLGQWGTRFDEQAKGHGLGLAIVCDIIDQYHGHIEFEDAELGGLRVRVTLPER